MFSFFLGDNAEHWQAVTGHFGKILVLFAESGDTLCLLCWLESSPDKQGLGFVWCSLWTLTKRVEVCHFLTAMQVSRCLQEQPLFTVFCIAFHSKILNIFLCCDDKAKQLWNITLKHNGLFSCLPIFHSDHGCLSWFYVCWGLELVLVLYKMKKTLQLTEQGLVLYTSAVPWLSVKCNERKA